MLNILGDRMLPERTMGLSEGSIGVLLQRLFTIGAIAVALALAACGSGGSRPVATLRSPSPTATSALVAPSPTAAAPRISRGVAAALADPCSALSNTDLAPFGPPSESGTSPRPGSGGGVTTATCFWPYGSRSTVELTVRSFSDEYAGAIEDFVKNASANSAQLNSGTIEDVPGVADYAAITFPNKIGPSLSASFYAMKGRVVVEVTFQATKTSVASNWPTVDALKQVGEAAAGNIF